MSSRHQPAIAGPSGSSGQRRVAAAPVPPNPGDSPDSRQFYPCAPRGHGYRAAPTQRGLCTVGHPTRGVPLSKHRRASPPARTTTLRRAASPSKRHKAPLPEPVRETLVWGPVACLLVPFALVWSGIGWGTALAVGGLLALLAVLCWGALMASGMSLRNLHRQDWRR